MMGFFMTAASQVSAAISLTALGDTIFDASFDSGEAAAGVRLFRDGTFTQYRFVGASTNPPDEWILDAVKTATIGDNYEVRCTLLSGSLASNAGVNIWLRLDTTRIWQVNAQPEQGSVVADVRYEFRPFGGTNILFTSNDIRLEASSF